MGARLRRTLAVLVVLATASLVGCSTLPDSGAVHRQAADRPERPQDAPYFNPPGPAKDDDPAAIVSGFLVAMQANPLTTSVARQFLSERARRTWLPNRGTILYENFKVTTNSTGARVRLSDTQRLDSRGGWRGDAPGRPGDLDITLVSEKGQWRIDNPVNALVVPTGFFDRSFARFNLYFYDQTGRALLPEPVFIPRGEQTATNLVRGLLAGPGRALAEVSRSALPSRTGLDLSVVVTGSGVAEVPLSREVLQASPSELSRAVDQLARTLRQVPGIERVRITVGGAPVPLPGGRVDAPVTSGPELDAGANPDSRLWGLRGSRVLDLSASAKGTTQVDGPFGRLASSARSFAVSEAPRSIAAVSADGRSVSVSSTSGRSTSPQVRLPVTGATDLLRPSYDLFGDLWLIDRTRRGARVLVVDRDGVRELRVPGVTGVAVAAFSMARDGSRLAVAYPGNRARPVRIVDILRTDEGTVSGAGRSRTLATGTGDDGPVVDVGWRDPATLAILSRPSNETSQVDFISTDGSPTATDLVAPSLFRGTARSMVVAPDLGLPLRLITPDQRLYTLSGDGTWPRTSSEVSAAAYAG